MTPVQWVSVAVLTLMAALIIATECVARRRDRREWDAHLRNVARFADRWSS